MRISTAGRAFARLPANVSLEPTGDLLNRLRRNGDHSPAARLGVRRQTRIRVKLIKDIRFYEFNRLPGPGVGGALDGSLYTRPTGAAALGRRIALKLREAGLRVGSFDHLYLALTPALPADALVDTGWGGEPWRRYIASGLPTGFNVMPARERLALLARRSFAAVRLLVPEAEPIIAETERLLEQQGDGVRIRLLRRATRRLAVEVSFTVAGPGATPPSQAWVAVTDLVSGRSRAVPFLDLEFSDDVFSIVSRVAVKGRVLEMHPGQSERAKLDASRYTVPIRVSIDDVLGA
jgi:hypothetical protein